jgi:hypothetical protein
VLVFVMGSTTPFLTEKFQDSRWVITDRVNGSPVWAAEGGELFMYRAMYRGCEEMYNDDNDDDEDDASSDEDGDDDASSDEDGDGDGDGDDDTSSAVVDKNEGIVRTLPPPLKNGVSPKNYKNMMIGRESDCAAGRAAIYSFSDFDDGEGYLERTSYIYNTEETADVVAPTELPSDKWASNETATLATQYASAERLSEGRITWNVTTPAYAPVPNMRITPVHGLSDDDPAMAEALGKLAALTALA